MRDNNSFTGLCLLLSGSTAAEVLLEHSVDDGASIDSKTFRQDVNAMRTRLVKRRRGLFKPNGRRLQFWDLITSVALLFVVVDQPKLVRG